VIFGRVIWHRCHLIDIKNLLLSALVEQRSGNLMNKTAEAGQKPIQLNTCANCAMFSRGIFLREPACLEPSPGKSIFRPIDEKTGSLLKAHDSYVYIS